MAGVWDILTTVGSRIINQVVPFGLGNDLINLVNKELPKDKQLPVNATGQQVAEAANSLTPEQRASLQAKQFDIDLATIQEKGDTLRTMLDADANNPHSTRPHIALGSFYLLAVLSVLIVGSWAWAVVSANDKVVTAIVDGWPWVVGILAPFVGFLNAYMGILRDEQRNKLAASCGGQMPPAPAGLISRLIGK